MTTLITPPNVAALKNQQIFKNNPSNMSYPTVLKGDVQTI